MEQFGGTFFILSSVVITSTIIFFLVRKYGKEFIYESFPKEKIDKIENSKVFQNPKNIELIIGILFALIGTPKDLLVYIGGLLPIKPTRFVLISTFAGAYFVEGNWKFGFIVYGISFIITIIGLFIIRFFDKEKITKRALRELK